MGILSKLPPSSFLGFATITFLLFSPNVSGQVARSSWTNNDVEFMTYLVNNRLYENALTLSHLLKLDDSIQADTLWYLVGWSHYNLKQLDSATVSLLNVSKNHSTFAKSRFFSAYCAAHSRNTNSAKNILSAYQPSNEMLDELKRTQLAGLALLTKDLETYNKISSTFSYSYYSFAENQRTLDEINMSIANFNHKSPFVAGLFSALIPGSGKMYAGKVGSGLSSLFTVGILGALTWENYNRDGLLNPKTIIFGSLFTVAYSANIYGSVFSVKAYRDEYNKKIEHRILFNLHIPIRNVFN